MLILTPVNEGGEYLGIYLQKELAKRGISSLSVAAFKDYLKTTQLAANEEEAIFKALVSVKDYVDYNQDCVIIGNSPRSVSYDLITQINVEQKEGELEEDHQLLKMREKYADDEELADLLNTYISKDAESHLAGPRAQVLELITNLWTTIRNSSLSYKA